jgi:hypothetical protein
MRRHHRSNNGQGTTMSTTDDSDYYTTEDLECMSRAIKLALEGDDLEFAELIQTKLDEDDEIEAGTFASYSLQNTNLGLKPWQTPPLHLDLEGPTKEPDLATAELCRQMDRFGVSRLSPDPLSDLAKRKAAAK